MKQNWTFYFEGSKYIITTYSDQELLAVHEAIAGRKGLLSIESKDKKEYINLDRCIAITMETINEPIEAVEGKEANTGPLV